MNTVMLAPSMDQEVEVLAKAKRPAFHAGIQETDPAGGGPLPQAW